MLSVAGLTRRFGDHLALDDVTFDVVPGRMTGFVGANGAGKTTTMRIMLGVLAPSAGQALWNGVPLTARDPQRLRLHAGGARAVPEDEDPRPADLLRPPARPRPGAGRGADRQDPRPARPDRAVRRHAGDALAGQPAAGPDRGRARARADRAGARRAVQRARPAGRRRDGRPAARGGHAGGAGAVLQPPARTGRAAVRRPRRTVPRQGRRGGLRGVAVGRLRVRRTGW